jgi:hypothetical protein
MKNMLSAPKTLKLLPGLLITMVLVFTLIATIAIPASAATLYERYNSGDDVPTAAIYGSILNAQTFTPTITHTITSVKLKLVKAGSPGTVTVSIKATNTSGQPTGSDLCSGTFDGNSITQAIYTSGGWYEITLGSGCSLSAGTQYAIVVQAASGTASKYICWRYDLTNAYAAGNMLVGYVTGGTSYWTSTLSGDGMFEEYGYIPQAATPLTVSPASGNYGGTANLSATLTSGGVRVSGKTINFTLNGNSVGSAATVANGVATLSGVSISGISVGTHSGYVAASFAGDGSYLTSSGSNSLTVNQVATSLTVSPASGDYGGTANLSATLTSGGAGVAGATIYFTLNGTAAGSAVTDTNGVATISVASLSGIDTGTYPAGVGASFGGSTNYVASSGTNSLTVHQLATSLTTISASGNFGGTVNLSATLTSGGAGVAGATIYFTLNGNPVGSAVTNEDGVANLMGASLAGIANGIYDTGVGASFAGSTNYAASSGTNSLTVSGPGPTVPEVPAGLLLGLGLLGVGGFILIRRRGSAAAK